MANLAAVDPHVTAVPDPANNRSDTIPTAAPAAPESEINARVYRPNTDNADQLARILGVASDVAQQAFSQDQQRRDNRDASQALLDFSEGNKDAQRFSKSVAYRNAWQLQGAKKLSVDIGAEVAQAVSDRLNDSDHPATPEDIDGIIEGIFQKHTTDSTGKLLDFGTPEAKMTLANSLQEVRAQIIPKALAAIKHQQDAKFLGTWGDNAVTEYYRGAPIGATLKNDPLAPLPDNATVTVEPAPYYAPTDGAPPVAGGKPAEPFKGFYSAKPTSVMGAPRQGGSRHNGEDYSVPTGTPLAAPMAGKVIAAFSNARGGNQVRVQMADGAIVGYAHLSRLDVKQGDTVQAGQTVGLSGATGDATGPHVHMTVEVNGKKVSPKSYFAGAQVPTGLAAAPTPTPTSNNAIALDTVPTTDQAPADLPPFNFERAMSELPPSIDKGDAKKFLLQSIINQANAKGDVGILSGLEDSRRADGSPSFTPDEVATIQTAREEIADKARVDAARAKQALWKQNGDKLLTAMVGGNPPSDAFIANAAAGGLIEPSMAYTLIEHNQAARKEDEREARAEQREADFEANSDYDAFVAGEAARMSVGDFSGASSDDLFRSGKLGPPGKKALSRYNTLKAAERQGEERNRENPLYGQYMGQLRMQYGLAATNPFLAPQFQVGGVKVNYYGMTAFYKLRVSKGEEPEEAYLETIAKFGPPQDAASARKKLIAELQVKKNTGQ
jgi:murein DD-endopeptidase MepM/ murein hydrolase activator NlpD